MDLKTFIADPARRKLLAEACGTSGDWLYQISVAWQGRKASTDLAKAIERESAAIGPECVPKESLRPDIWPPADGQKAAA